MTTREPAVLFHLWNPLQTEASTFTFDVTQANIPRIGRPDPRWLDAACQALGVARNASDCHTSALRSSYFTDEPEAKAPEDRWPDCWTIQASVHKERLASSGCGAAPVPLAVLDPSWDGTRDPGHDERALIMALGDAVSAHGVLADAVAAATTTGLETISAALAPCADGRVGVRLLTSCVFPTDAVALEVVTRRLGEAGWATNWRRALLQESSSARRGLTR
jgi:hypothetical protein